MKYFIANTRQEVKPGEVFKMCTHEETEFGITERCSSFVLNEKNIPILISRGILVEADTAPIPENIEYYLEKVAKKLGWKLEKTCNIFDVISDVNLGVVFSLILKEIAVTIDKKYPDHIKNSKYFFYISLEDGLIHRLDKCPKNFNWISIFRTKGDALLALRILGEVHAKMFPELHQSTPSEQKD